MAHNAIKRLIYIVFLLAGSTVIHAAGGGGGSPSPYFEIPTPFVVNLADDNHISFLQVNAQFKVKNNEHKSLLHNHMPGIIRFFFDVVDVFDTL